jgi:DNA transposition AAA+ family ATPase
MNLDLGKTAFTPEEIDDLRDRMKAFKDKRGLSWTDLAKISGVAQGTLSSWVPGTYNGGRVHENQDVPRQVHRFFLGLEEKETLEAALPSEPDFQMTPSAHRMMTCLAMAQLGDMALISTPPGCGKSAACRQYAATRAGVWIATASPSTKGVPTILGAILEAMGERPGSRHPASLSARVRKRVTGAAALIIIDEAQELTPMALNELRAIHDSTDCGVALVGDETLWTTLRQYPQLYSRLGIRHSQGRPTPQDVAVIAQAWGVNKGAELAYLQDLSRKGGGIRTVTKTMKLAVRSARAGGAPLEIGDLRDAASQRYGEGG